MRRVSVVIALSAALALGLSAGERRSEGAPADKPPGGKSADLTGVYEMTGVANLAIVQGQDELWLSYDDSWGETANMCDCIAQGVRQTDGSWQITGDFKGTLRVVRGKPTLTNDDNAGCCGAGWPGFARVRKKSGPARSCVVTAKKLVFKDTRREPSKTYVIAGDHVDAVDAPNGDTDKVLARFDGKKKTTLGLLDTAGLDCGKKP